MAYTVDAAFAEFFSAINLDGDHRETANARRDRILSLLEDKLTVLDAFASGSIPRFTAVREHADVDVIVALHYGKHIKDKLPSQVLQAVRDALSGSATQVRKNGQAVTLSFKTWPDVDIVPATQVANNGQITHYEIPDMTTEQWLVSDPKTHSQDIAARSTSCGENFRKIIKMYKWWNKQHSDLLQSYHIEVMALEAFSSDLSDLPWQVRFGFERMASLAAAPLWHGRGYADTYLNADQRAEVCKRLERARDDALMAWYSGSTSPPDYESAIAKWRSVFGTKFPTYG